MALSFSLHEIMLFYLFIYLFIYLDRKQYLMTIVYLNLKRLCIFQVGYISKQKCLFFHKKRTHRDSGDKETQSNLEFCQFSNIQHFTSKTSEPIFHISNMSPTYKPEYHLNFPFKIMSSFACVFFAIRRKICKTIRETSEVYFESFAISSQRNLEAIWKKNLYTTFVSLNKASVNFPS